MKLSLITLPVASAPEMPAGGAFRGLVEAGRFADFFSNAVGSSRSTLPILKQLPSLATLQSQIAAMLQSGMSLSTIVQQLAQRLADTVSAGIQTATNQAVDTASKNTLVQTFLAALSPPGGSPSTGPPDEASALVQRLTQLTAAITGGTQNAGQQNRLSGQILDANTAEEIPAQQQNGQAPSEASLLAAVQSMLSDTIASLAPASSAGTQNAAQQQQATQNAQNPNQSVQNAAAQTQLQSLAQGAAQAPAAAAQSAAVQSAVEENVLGRMISRAVMASSKFGLDTASASNPVQAEIAQPTASSAQAQTPATVDVHAAVTALVSSITDALKNQNGPDTGQNPNAFGSNSWEKTFASWLQQSSPSSPADASASSFAVQTNGLLGATSQGVASSSPAVATTTVPSYVNVDPNSIIEQVVQGMVVRNAGNDSVVRMQLSPPHLGDVSVKLNVNNGNVAATVLASNADVRDVLLANQGQLHRALNDAGLKLTGFSVDVSGGGPNGSGVQQQLAQMAGPRRFYFDPGGSTQESDALAAVPNFGPPGLVAPGKGLFNYLA